MNWSLIAALTCTLAGVTLAACITGTWRDAVLVALYSIYVVLAVAAFDWAFARLEKSDAA